MNYSFKDFATQFAGIGLPTGALAVGKSLGAAPPFSLRSLMSQGAPYAPAGVSPVVSSGVTAFFWLDIASAPPWVNTPSANASRIATSWVLQVWEDVGNAKGAQLINATINRNASDAFNQIQYDYAQALDGVYFCEVTAYNNYGSASTGVFQATINPPVNPQIAVTRVQGNIFHVTGSGFTPSGPVQVNADIAIGGQAIPTIDVTATDSGTLPTVTAVCTTICSQAAGGGLTFQAQDMKSGNTSNTVTNLICAT
jgi:hypothetical protein